LSLYFLTGNLATSMRSIPWQPLSICKKKSQNHKSKNPFFNCINYFTKKKKTNFFLPTKLRLDLEAMRKDLLEAFKWIRAQMSLVQTKTMNIVLTAKPIIVITKLIPDEIIVKN
jgi:hypothetical protein